MRELHIREDDLNQFVEGDYVDVKMIDDERLVPEARGITLRCCVESIGWEFEDGTPGGDHAMVLRARPIGDQVLSRAVDHYVIQDWQVESIKRVDV